MILSNKDYKIAVPTTESEKRVGLSNKDSIEVNEGMLFKNVNIITMKNTKFPLKLVFLDNNLKVIDIQEAEPYATQLYKNNKATHTLELHPEAEVEIEDELEDNYIFVYDDYFEGQPYTLTGYELKNNKVILSEGGSIKGKLAKRTMLNKGYSNIHIKDNIYTYSTEPAYVLDEVGDVQMLMEGNERIFSIPHTLELIKLVNNIEDPEDYNKLGARLIEILDLQDTQKQEFI